MRYRLRTLLIVVGVMPPALATLWFVGPTGWFLSVLGIYAWGAVYMWFKDNNPTAIGRYKLRTLLIAVVLVAVGALLVLLVWPTDSNPPGKRKGRILQVETLRP